MGTQANLLNAYELLGLDDANDDPAAIAASIKKEAPAVKASPKQSAAKPGEAPPTARGAPDLGVTAAARSTARSERSARNVGTALPL